MMDSNMPTLSPQLKHCYSVISFWAAKFKESTPDQQKAIRDRVAVVRGDLVVGVACTALNGWFLWGRCKSHNLHINDDFIYCDCSSFLTSGPPDDKKPCKHLYALACGVVYDF
jgi:predicted nucleic acid-binding Zn finger protein